MTLEQELRSLISELRKHNATYDSILLHALMANRKHDTPWHEDDVRRFIRSCDAAPASGKPAQRLQTPYNIVVASESVGGVELKDFEAVVQERSAEAAQRQKTFRDATESQRMVPQPRRRGRPPKIRYEEEKR